jgi:hypothetical protein
LVAAVQQLRGVVMLSELLAVTLPLVPCLLPSVVAFLLVVAVTLVVAAPVSAVLETLLLVK